MAEALLERDRQLALLDEWLAAASKGLGRVGLMLAGAGLGKTTLLRQGAARAGEFGIRVLSARGSELERDLAFGVVRQLFEVELGSLDDSQRARVLEGAAANALPALAAPSESSSTSAAGVIHGLYWLTMNLAERAPMLLLVDDAHWADAQTLRWLIYLAPRVAATPLFVLAAARPSEPGAENSWVEALRREEAVEVVGLDPLSPGAIGEVISEQFGRAGDETFVSACARATGGNPFYLRELLRTATLDRIEPVAAQAARVPAIWSSEIARAILARLARLGQSTHQLARAVAVLGVDAQLQHAAEMSDMTADAALDAVDTLTEAEILRRSRPLEFIHPIARAAVYGDLSQGERSRAHRRAAEMLAVEAAGPERIASHVIQCEPAADPAVVEWLRAAAADALAAGAPDAAAHYLRRALDEPPAADERPQMQFELGRALASVDLAAAAASFADAAGGADTALRLLAYRWRAQTLGFGGRPGDAVEAAERAIDLAGEDAELTLLLEATRDFFALGWLGDDDWSERSLRLQRRAADLVGATPGERRTLAVAAFDIARTGASPAARAIELAQRVRRALTTWLDEDAGVETAAGIGESSIIADDPEALARHERAAAEAARRGMVTNHAAARAQTAHIHYRLGNLREAEADARSSWALLEAEREGAATFYWWSLATLIEVLTARGALDEAASAAVSGRLPSASWEASCTIPSPPAPPIALAELMLAQGRRDEGLELVTKAGARLEEHGWANPSLNPWRPIAAEAMAATGRRDEAWGLVESAVRRARDFGAPWALGLSLRAAGVVEQGKRGLELLDEAIEVLDGAGCRLELARALLERGATLRRANRRAEARESLRAALDLASRCGAAPLAERAREEIAATGARPRREVLTGVESLTASELRVAQMASEGMSNPEIAQALFVTRKTVEKHLGNAYMKLDITSREELPGALRAEGAKE